MHRVPVEQADVGLLHEIRRLPADRQALTREQPASHPPKLAVHERRQLFQGLRVTAAPRLQQPGHVGGQRLDSIPVAPGCRSESPIAPRPPNSACSR